MGLDREKSVNVVDDTHVDSLSLLIYGWVMAPSPRRYLV